MRMSIIATAVFFWGIAVTSAAETDTAAANEALIRHELEALNRGDWKTAVQDFAMDGRNLGRPLAEPLSHGFSKISIARFPIIASRSWIC